MEASFEAVVFFPYVSNSGKYASDAVLYGLGPRACGFRCLLLSVLVPGAGAAGAGGGAGDGDGGGDGGGGSSGDCCAQLFVPLISVGARGYRLRIRVLQLWAQEDLQRIVGSAFHTPDVVSCALHVQH